MITFNVSNIFTDITGDLPDSLYRELEKEMSFRPEGYVFSPQYNRWIRNKEGKPVRRMWDGWRKLCWKNKKQTYFPTGLLNLATDYLKQKNVPFQYSDRRQKPERSLDLTIDGKFEFRDYQIPAIDKACNVSRGIIRFPTGAGKTFLSGGIVAKLGASPFIYFVTSIDLLTQAKESLQEILRLNGSPLEVGQIGAGVIDIRDVNVMTVQTAVRALGKSWNTETKFDTDDTDDDTTIESRKEEIAELIHSAKGAISDEIQRWRADTCQLVARELKSAYYTYGLSATPFRDSGDDMLIQACFGKIIAEISFSELIDRGYLVAPHIKMLHLKQPKSIFKQWQSIYKDQVVENERYNTIVANLANKFCDAGRTVLILSQQVAHGKHLSDMIAGSIYLSGNSPKKKREEGLRKLRNRDLRAISSSVIFDEGIDVRALDTVILSGQGKSRVRALQRIGRALRPYEDERGKKEKATIIDFYLHQKYLDKHAKARLKMYRSEPRFQVEEIEIE